MKAIILTVGLFATGASLPVQAADCVNGDAAGYDCSHVNFVAHLPPAQMNGSGEVLNDIWGWVDTVSGGTEYALVGMEDGTAFVRLDGDNPPVFLGRLPASDGDQQTAKATGTRAQSSCHDECGGGTSAWRDIKVYGNHAYVVSEAGGHGLQIFDLTALRAKTDATDFIADVAEDYYGYYAGFGSAHNIFINEDTARAYVVGYDRTSSPGGILVLDIADPMQPVELQRINADGYTHDVQCVVYAGPDEDAGDEICLASNEDTVTIWNLSGATAALVSKTPYSASGYTHQGWLSEDHRYFFVNDELDEIQDGTRTHLRVFDVSDLDNPALVAEYHAPTFAIDHNNYVHGRWLYQSNYAAGLRILDVLDPLHPVEAAYFDPQAGDNAAFYGTWSNYAFPSGLTVLSDINAGLFVVRPALLEGGISPDIAVTLSMDEEATFGQDAQGEVTVITGAAVAADDVLLTLHLPDGARFASITPPAGWACSGVSGNRIQACRSAQREPAVTDNFTFSVTPLTGGTMQVIAMAYANAADAEPADNLDAVTLQVKGSGSSTGGGGGGGVFAWLLIVLAPLAARAVRYQNVRGDS